MRFVPRHHSVGTAPASPRIVRERIDAALPPQGFTLVLGTDGTEIRAADALGNRYARDTLAALAHRGELRVGELSDWPDLPNRAFMLDVSRDRVPTNDTLRWLVGLLAELRYTQLQLYVEHTYAYEGHDVVWRDASPLTADDLRALDDMCTDNGIELVANLNTFGHMDRWLRHDRYRPRAECPDGSPPLLGGALMPPWSLAPTAENAELACALAREMLGALRSGTVNIGADEPFDLGRGHSAADVAARGRAAVYLDHLRRIVDPLVADGFHVQFWGDVLRRHPELVAQLPTEGATAIVWNYEAPTPDGPPLAALLGPELVEVLGLPDDAHLGFAAHVRSYVETGYPFWVAGGTSTWNTLLGRWTNARANLLDAATIARTSGARGFMVTDWGDNGHHHPLPVSVAALAYGAAVAWNATSHAELDVAPVIDELLHATPGTGALLLELGQLYERIGTRSFNGSAIAMALYRKAPLPVFGTADADGLADAATLLDRAVEHFAGQPFEGERSATIAQELHAVSFLARHAVHRLQHGAGLPIGRAELDAEWDRAQALQRQAWLATSRPGGLDDSLRRLGPPT